MSESEVKLNRSIELAKAGFENAQARISAIDTKVSIAVGLLIVLLPAPLAVAGWFITLEKDACDRVYGACANCWHFSALVGLALFAGMLCALVAIFRGVAALTPRGPKGYGRCGPFHNEWKPNALFPLHGDATMDRFCKHISQLDCGIDHAFVLSEYGHQLEQLGGILDKKFTAMGKCFIWLKRCFLCYGAAVFSAALIGILRMVHLVGS